MHILLVINNLSPGTGPFQRAIKFKRPVRVSVVSLFDSQQRVEEVASQFGADTRHLKIYGLGARNKISALFAFHNVSKKIDPDIIQSAHTFTDVASLVVKALSRKAVIAFEGTLVTRWSLPKRYFVLVAHALMDKVICVSNVTCQVNSSVNTFLSKLTRRVVIYNGVDLSLVQTKDSNGEKECSDKFIVGYTGDLKPDKNIHLLVRALSKFECGSTNVELVLVGAGPDRKFLERLSAELGVNVVFTGQVSRVEVFHKLKTFDVFVMPSLVEGLSESIVQAMASKVPVLVSDIEPNREPVIDNYSGLLFKSGDYDSLYQRLKLILEGHVDLESLTENAYDFVVNNLDVDDIVKRYVQEYAKALS